MKQRVSLLLASLMLAAPAGAAQSYIYVATAPPPCTSPSPCAPGQLLVFDAITRELVTSAPLGTAANLPRGMAISQDGRRLYISMGPDPAGDTSLVVYDTSRHVMGSTFPIAPPAAGLVAVNRDGSRVFVGGSARLVVWDTQLTGVSAVRDDIIANSGLFGHPTLDRILAGATSPMGPVLTVYALDSMTGVLLATKNESFGQRLTMSPDGTRMYDTLTASTINPSSGGHVYIYDPVTLDRVGSIGPCPACFPSMTVDAPARDRAYILDATSLYAFNRTSGASLASLSMPYAASDVVISGDQQRAWVASVQRPPSFTPRGVDQLTIVDLNTFSTAGSIALPTNPVLLAAAPAGAASCSYRLDSLYSSWARNGGTGNVRLTTTCGWAVTASSASWVHLTGPATGLGNTTFGLTVDAYPPPPSGPYVTRSATVTIGGQVLTVTQGGANTQPPFGFIDTPADNSTGITGSLPVTGWALDDVGVARVRIFRDPVFGEPARQIYLGDATFVDGARPDVQAAFPSLPFASRAGWGYLLLTNMLPARGTGTYHLFAYADDIDGRSTLLGSRAITCTNSTASSPFGAIDTPGQGEVVSGTITNWGWALTPQSATIPLDGSTIDVVIDGAVVGHPTYNVNRPDVAALFPGYANTNGAGGYFTFDTTTLANGVHTIAWLVRDNMGSVTAVGSRYFTVANP